MIEEGDESVSEDEEVFRHEEKEAGWFNTSMLSPSQCHWATQTERMFQNFLGLQGADRKVQFGRIGKKKGREVPEYSHSESDNTDADEDKAVQSNSAEQDS